MARPPKKKPKTVVDFMKVVSPYDIPLSLSGNTKGRKIWKGMRGKPRKPKDPEREAQILRDAFVEKVSQEYPKEVAALGRNPMILAKVPNETEDTLRLANREGEVSHWRRATAPEIFEHINNSRPTTDQTRNEQGNEDQHELHNMDTKHASEDGEDENMQNVPDERNDANYARGKESENGDHASISTFSVGTTLDDRREYKTTLSDESLEKLNKWDSPLPDARMKQLIYGECQNIHDLLAVYSSTQYQNCLARIWYAREHSNMEPVDWAKKWAEELSMRKKEAVALDSDRRIVLWLPYAMCNLWGGPKKKSRIVTPVTEEDIVNVFGQQRILYILSNCLFMDRASAWYNLRETGRQNGKRGVHWYAEAHKDFYRENRKDREHTHTMNRRLIWLFKIKGLGLRKIPYLVELIKPARTPLADPDRAEDGSSNAFLPSPLLNEEPASLVDGSRSLAHAPVVVHTPVVNSFSDTDEDFFSELFDDGSKEILPDSTNTWV